ncbi:MAG: PcfB family protein [Peptococcaceae bacterium]|jgi:hypothetical protein|nr:PcfB family protein [Peptococcaceae bacterium]
MVALTVKGTKLTGRLLAKAMQAFLSRAQASPKPRLGKQSIKALTKQGTSLTNIEIMGDNIGDFKRVPRASGVIPCMKISLARPTGPRIRGSKVLYHRV